MHTFKSKQAWWPVENPIQIISSANSLFTVVRLIANISIQLNYRGVYEGLCSTESSKPQSKALPEWLF